MRRTPKPIFVVLSSALLALLGFGCQKEAAPQGPQRVENATLRFAVSDLATGCSLSRNEGADLELICNLDGEPGTVTFEVGEEERGVNLLEKAKAQKEWFLAQSAGEFLGNRELVTPIGAAYTARGLYSHGGQAVEESRVLTLHPDKRHAILVRYRYAPGDRPATQDRMDQLLYIVGEITSLESADAPVATDAGEGDAVEPTSEGAASDPVGTSPDPS